MRIWKKRMRGSPASTAPVSYTHLGLAYAAECDEIDTVIPLITSENAASIHLHEVYGFEYCGQIKNAGTKFGRKLSLNAYQILYDLSLIHI